MGRINPFYKDPGTLADLNLTGLENVVEEDNDFKEIDEQTYVLGLGTIVQKNDIRLKKYNVAASKLFDQIEEESSLASTRRALEKGAGLESNRMSQPDNIPLLPQTSIGFGFGALPGSTTNIEIRSANEDWGVPLPAIKMSEKTPMFFPGELSDRRMVFSSHEAVVSESDWIDFHQSIKGEFKDLDFDFSNTDPRTRNAADLKPILGLEKRLGSNQK